MQYPSSEQGAGLTLPIARYKVEVERRVARRRRRRYAAIGLGTATILVSIIIMPSPFRSQSRLTTSLTQQTLQRGPAPAPTAAATESTAPRPTGQQPSTTQLASPMARVPMCIADSVCVSNFTISNVVAHPYNGVTYLPTDGILVFNLVSTATQAWSTPVVTSGLGTVLRPYLRSTGPSTPAARQDVTDFAPVHPGGATVTVRCSGPGCPVAVFVISVTVVAK